jgi:hypothetical protein
MHCSPQVKDIIIIIIMMMMMMMMMMMPLYVIDYVIYSVDYNLIITHSYNFVREDAELLGFVHSYLHSAQFCI